MYLISDELKEFIESGAAVVVGTTDGAGRPEIAYGWGTRVHADDRDRIDVFVETQRCERTLANIAANGRVAVTWASPTTYRSIQLKGMGSGPFEPAEGDQAWVQRHRDAFSAATALVGDPPTATRNSWMDPVVRIEVAVERAFDQTPGPNAGKPL